jgi:hypothetical protein
VPELLEFKLIIISRPSDANICYKVEIYSINNFFSITFESKVFVFCLSRYLNLKG